MRSISMPTPVNWVGVCALMILCSAGAAETRENLRPWGPMPEPVLGESVTDIDGTRAGELEVDLTGFAGRSSSWGGSVEIETRVLDWLGVEVELGYSRGPSAPQTEGELELRLLASLSLLHDFERGLHGQLEIGGRLVGDLDTGPNLGEPRVPISSGLRLGLDRRWWTLRLGLGVGLGDGSAHQIPSWASATAFLNFGPDRWISLGLNGEADWTRRNPFTLAPTILVDGRIVHWPGRFALVTPYAFAGGGMEQWFGVVLRLIGEFDFGPADRD